MGTVSESAASLRFSGDDLVPEEISRLIGAAPQLAYAEGERWLGTNGREHLGRTGLWSLSVERRSPADLPGQIDELLSPLSQDLSIWRDLTGRFRAEIFCGLFVDGGNQGLTLPPTTMQMLADRRLALDFDIYSRDN